MTLFLVRALSQLLAAMPEWLCRWIVNVLAGATYYGLPGRRRTILSNLSHAFPERPHAWLTRMGRRTCRRMIETGMLAIVIPKLTPERILSMVRPAAGMAATLDALVAARKPAVLVSPHIGAWELGTTLPLIYGKPLPALSIVYRPLRNPVLDSWVRSARERFGFRMLSRRTGFAEGMRILRAGGVYSVLFDQHAGATGRLTLLCERVCSTTTLPGLMVEKFDALLITIVVHRTGFWRYELTCSIEEDAPRDTRGVTLLLNEWLDRLLRSDEETCAGWLWPHNRWKAQSAPGERFRLDRERSLLPADELLPRRMRLFLRMPDSPREVEQAFSLIRALRRSRPDAELTAVAGEASVPLLEESGLFEHCVSMPAARVGRLRAAWKQRRRFPDCWFTFSDSLVADLEGFLTRCPQRFGAQHEKQFRPLLTHGWKPGPDVDWRAESLSRTWERALRHFGLEGEIDSRSGITSPGADGAAADG